MSTSQNTATAAVTKKNNGVKEQVKTVLFDKLLHGFKTITEVMSSMHISTSFRVIHLPISTRAIGFTIRYLVAKIARLDIRAIDYHQLCGALYRVSLIMYQLKMVNARAVAAYRNPAGNGFLEFEIPHDVISIIGQLGVGFSPLINLISSVGVLHAFNTTFVPRHPAMTAIDAIRQVDPTLLTIANLRSTVVALSAAGTNQEVRQWFYDHSPIPNAVWSEPLQPGRADEIADPVGDANHPLLLNPDEVIPDGYANAHIRADINIISDALDIIGRKYPKYVHVGRIDYSCGGNYSMLVSSEVGDLRCANLTVQHDYTGPTLEGDTQLYWSIDKLAEPEFYSGVLHLLGELPRKPPAIFAIRSLHCAKQDASHAFVDALGNLVG